MRLPNILFILADDLGSWALRSAGNTEVITPSIDALAQEGIQFDNFFCASPVCSPARATLLTGCMPSAHGVLDWIRGGNLNREDIAHWGDDPRFADESSAVPYLAGKSTYTQRLAEHGYQCGLSGKWHLGDSIRPQQGFDYWFTIGRGGSHYQDTDVIEHGVVKRERRYLTEVITDKGIEFLEQRTPETPFYLSLHYTAPHDPWGKEEHPEEVWDLYEDCPFTATPNLPIHPWQIPTADSGTGQRRKDILRGYYTAITGMDQSIGRLLKYLKDSQLMDDTLIIFTSDNGMNMGHHGIWGKGNGTFPFNMYDTAVKVPFIVRCPQGKHGGKRAKELYSQYDVFPTLLEYAGIPQEPLASSHKDPTRRPSATTLRPGTSFAPVLWGEPESETPAIVVCDEYGPVRMIRTKEWKYIHRYPYGPHELYHLTRDPQEKDNLIDHPEQEHQIAALRWQMEEWFYSYTDPATDGAKEGVSGFGQLRKAGLHSQGQKTFYTHDSTTNKEST